MRFLVDESTGPAVARWLGEQGHDVFSVYDQARGMDDDGVIRMAGEGNWILITNDRDFGEKVYREGWEHHGVILLRLVDERAKNKILVLERMLDQYGDRIAGRFVVVTESHVRFGAQRPGIG